MLPTSREYFFSFFGILLAGGIPGPFSHRYGRRNLMSICFVIATFSATVTPPS